MEEFLTPMWRPVSTSECAGPERPAKSCSVFGEPANRRTDPRSARSSSRTSPCRSSLPPRTRPHRARGRRARPGADAGEVACGAGPHQVARRQRPQRAGGGCPSRREPRRRGSPVQVGVDERRRRRAGQLSSGVDGRVGQSRGHRGPKCRLLPRDGGGDVGGVAAVSGRPVGAGTASRRTRFPAMPAAVATST